MSKISRKIVIPQVLNENRCLFLNLSQHGLEIASDIYLINNRGINILIFQMALDKV